MNAILEPSLTGSPTSTSTTDEPFRFIAGADPDLFRLGDVHMSDHITHEFERGAVASQHNICLAEILEKAIRIDHYPITSGYLYGSPRNWRGQINLGAWFKVHGFQNLLK